MTKPFMILAAFIALSSLFLFPAPAQAEELTKELPATGQFDDLRLMETATVDQVIDGFRLALRDGRIIQLSGIELPDYDPYEPGKYEVAARDLLQSLLQGKRVRIYQTKKKDTGRRNRMGYHLAQLQLIDKENTLHSRIKSSMKSTPGKNDIWVQGTLIANGLARAMPTLRNPEMAEQMLTLERKAREARLGLWTEEAFAIRTPDNAEGSIGKYSIIEGTIYKVARVKNRVYLNFGANWKTDFTIVVEPYIRRKLVKAGIDVLQLGGQSIRVRGWLESWNGPYIKLEHPTRLEILSNKLPLKDHDQGSMLPQTQNN